MTLQVAKKRVQGEWGVILDDIFKQPYIKDLEEFIDKEEREQKIYPPNSLYFNALVWSPFRSIKVVILGMDPYVHENQAHGLAFSVPYDVKPYPASLLNIYKELEDDLDVKRTSGCLYDWASQGVFLLNSILSVRATATGSHSGHGWETLTNRLIQVLSERKDHLVFCLWGRQAQEKEILIDSKKHTIIKSSHPSPLSVVNNCNGSPPFRGSKPFSKINADLEAHSFKPIKW